jgi:purine-binding chemotaxis protein CheW
METTGALNQYLTFAVAGEKYALDVLSVREVVALAPITRVPSAPNHVRGVVNLRGSVVPVVDLGVRFGTGPLALTPRTRFVVVELGRGPEQVVGFLVDAVHSVIALDRAELMPVPPFGAPATGELLSGMAVLDSGFVLIVVPERAGRIHGASEASS